MDNYNDLDFDLLDALYGDEVLYKHIEGNGFLAPVFTVYDSFDTTRCPSLLITLDSENYYSSTIYLDDDLKYQSLLFRINGNSYELDIDYRDLLKFGPNNEVLPGSEKKFKEFVENLIPFI